MANVKVHKADVEVLFKRSIRVVLGTLAPEENTNGVALFSVIVDGDRVNQHNWSVVQIMTGPHGPEEMLLARKVGETSSTKGDFVGTEYVLVLLGGYTERGDAVPYVARIELRDGDDGDPWLYDWDEAFTHLKTEAIMNQMTV